MADAAPALKLREKNAGARVRPCMRCRADFASEGPHNRLCGRCRITAQELNPQMAEATTGGDLRLARRGPR